MRRPMSVLSVGAVTGTGNSASGGCRSDGRYERRDPLVDVGGALEVQEVAGVGDELEPAAGREDLRGAARDRRELAAVRLAVQLQQRDGRDVEQAGLLGGVLVPAHPRQEEGAVVAQGGRGAVASGQREAHVGEVFAGVIAR